MPKERLQKILSRAGLLSRRKAEEAILAGRVRLNGQVVTELGTSADPGVDRLELDGQAVALAPVGRVILLFKPRMIVTTKSDPEGRRTVMDLLPPELQTLNPVGRLDFGSEGLLLLTDDGELLNRLTHPRYNVQKEYLALVQGQPTPSTLRLLTAGVTLEDGHGRFERATLTRTPPGTPGGPKPDEAWLQIIVTEGRNRFVRRMMEAVGHPVLRLRRVRQGAIALGDLREGVWRELTPEELTALKSSAGLAP